MPKKKDEEKEEKEEKATEKKAEASVKKEDSAEAGKATGEAKTASAKTAAPAATATKEEKAETGKEEKPDTGKETVAEKELSPKVKEALKTVEGLSVDERADFCISLIKGLRVLELSRWVKALEEEFGVSASAPVAAVAAGGPGQAGQGGEEEKKDSFTVVLSSAGDKKIQVIKEVRTITSLGLREAKALVDECPKPVKENVSEEEAKEIKDKLETAGATVELK